MKKKILLAVLFVCGIGLLGTGIYYQFFSTKQNNNDNELITVRLEKDFNAGKISADEYVRYSLYTEYDVSLLSKEYSSLGRSEVAVHTDELVNKYFEELSEETKRFYIENIALENVTFEMDKENDEEDDDSLALLDIFVEDVYAKKQKATNLNKAVLSSEGNFVVWYTTTGESAITKQAAEKVANDLEKTLDVYNEFSSNKFNFKGNILSEGKQHKNKKEILENLGIDTDYLTTAMQIYVVEYKDTSVAKFIQLPSKWARFWGEHLGTTDQFGATVYPYILLRPSSFDNYESVNQLFNHEFFHYYQYNVLCGKENCDDMMSDVYIVEASAQWASSLATNKTTNSGSLNEWAGTAKSYSSNLMSDEWAEQHGIDNVGYALYVYLNNYSNLVEDGAEKIVTSIYEKDALKYLQDNATPNDLLKIQEEIAYRNLSQDYSNKNLNVDPDFGAEIEIKNTITKDKKIKESKIHKLAIDYYLLDVSKEKQQFKITLKRDSVDVNVSIIGKSGKKYNLLQTSSLDENNFVFDTNDYDKYDKLYIAVTNSSLTKERKYSLDIKKTEKIEISSNKNNNEYISLLDCNAWNEYLDKSIATYYYDDEGKVTRYVITNIWANEDEAKTNYEATVTNRNYRNVSLDDKVVTYEHTEDAMKEYWNDLTKDSVISQHNYSCEGDAIVKNFEPNIITGNSYVELDIRGAKYRVKFKLSDPTNFWNSGDDFGAMEVDTVFIVSKNGEPIEDYNDIEELSGIIFMVEDRYFESVESIQSRISEWYDLSDVEVEDLSSSIFKRHIKGENSSFYYETYCLEYEGDRYTIELNVYKNNYSADEIKNIIEEYHGIISSLEFVK